jgi:hypothetical protein
VSETFEFVLMGNAQLLQSIHAYEFPKEKSVVSAESAKMFSDEKERPNENLLSNLVNRLKRFDPYTKCDIIRLLASVCMLGDSTVYINQEKIFNSFLDNRPIIFSCLLKLRYEKYLKIEKRERDGNEYVFRDYTLERFERLLEEGRNGGGGGGERR